MRGTLTIEASDYGYGIECELDDVGILDKFELLHSLATVLHMDDEEMRLYILAETLGIMKEAESQTQCMTTEQLQSLLKGEQPAGITIDLIELRRQLHES